MVQEIYFDELNEHMSRSMFMCPCQGQLYINRETAGLLRISITPIDSQDRPTPNSAEQFRPIVVAETFDKDYTCQLNLPTSIIVIDSFSPVEQAFVSSDCNIEQGGGGYEQPQGI